MKRFAVAVEPTPACVPVEATQPPPPPPPSLSAAAVVVSAATGGKRSARSTGVGTASTAATTTWRGSGTAAELLLGGAGAPCSSLTLRTIEASPGLLQAAGTPRSTIRRMIDAAGGLHNLVSAMGRGVGAARGLANAGPRRLARYIRILRTLCVCVCAHSGSLWASILLLPASLGLSTVGVVQQVVVDPSTGRSDRLPAPTVIYTAGPAPAYDSSMPMSDDEFELSGDDDFEALQPPPAAPTAAPVRASWGVGRGIDHGVAVASSSASAAAVRPPFSAPKQPAAKPRAAKQPADRGGGRPRAAPGTNNRTCRCEFVPRVSRRAVPCRASCPRGSLVADR